MSRHIANLTNSFYLAGYYISELPENDNEILIWNSATQTWIIAAVSTGGAIVGAANVGMGSGHIFKAISGGILDFRNILAGPGISVATVMDDVDIAVNPVQPNIQSISSLTLLTTFMDNVHINQDLTVFQNIFLPGTSEDLDNSNRNILSLQPITNEVSFYKTPWVYRFNGYPTDISLNSVTNGILFMTYTMPIGQITVSFDLFVYGDTNFAYAKRYRIETIALADTGYLIVYPSESRDTGVTERVDLNIRIDNTVIYFKAISSNVGGTPIGFNYKFIDYSDASGSYLLNNAASTETLSTVLFDSGVENVSLSDLRDVSVNSPSTGQILQYDGANFINQFYVQPMGQIIQTSAVPTITMVNTGQYYAMAGVSLWSFVQNGLSWFLNAGRLQLTNPGITNKYVKIEFTATFIVDKASQTLTWGIFKNGAVVGGSEFQDFYLSPGTVKNINIIFNTIADTNDLFEVRVLNGTSPGTVYTLVQTCIACTFIG